MGCAQIDIISKDSSVKICMVAEGVANEYPRFGSTMELDTATGDAIANAAGKKSGLLIFLLNFVKIKRIY